MNQTTLPVLFLATRLWLILVIFGSFASPIQAKSLFAAPRDAPQLISPVGGHIVLATPEEPKAIPVFRWQPVKNAVMYEIQVSASSDFRQGSLYYDRVTTVSDSWIPTDARLPDQVNLWWRVRAVDAAGTRGPYSPSQTFQRNWRMKKVDGQLSENTPELLLPADSEVLPALDTAQSPKERPGFSWTPVFGATQYHLQFSHDPSFEPVQTSFTTVSTSFQLPQRLAVSTYYWRVVPIMERGSSGPAWVGQASEARQFTIKNEVSAVPVLQSPQNGVELFLTPAFAWSPVTGAKNYTLQFSTSPSFPATVETITTVTSAASYTPELPLSNHKSYYWRVRVASGLFGPSLWSLPHHFSINWFPKVQLLTPVDGYEYTADPYLSWTPAAGAVKYRVEWSADSSFTNKISAETTHTYYVDNSGGLCPAGAVSTLFWRVIPMDGSGSEGEPSDPFRFTCSSAAQAPVLIYPPYYSSSHDLSSVPLPVFHWKRLLKADGVGGQHQAYRIQVSSSVSFAQPLWQMDTENMSAAPLHDLAPRTYFWRVRPLEQINGPEVGQWSQVWKMNYDPARLVPAKTTVELQQPAQGSEWVETLPLLEWLPQQGAASYQVQISRSPDLNTFTAQEYLVLDKMTEVPAYSDPRRLDAGTYYWRVSGFDVSRKPLPAGWSAPSFFEIEAQSRYQDDGSLAPNNQVLARDPADDVDPNYDLTDLIVTQSSDGWYFNFKANTAPESMRYIIYMDLDQKEFSGGDINPDGYPITTIPAHQPEYVISILQESGLEADQFSKSTAFINVWKDTTWGVPIKLGSLETSSLSYKDGRFELFVERDKMNLSCAPGSISVSMFTIGSEIEQANYAIDTLPQDPRENVQELRHFVTLTNHVSLIYPGNSLDRDPRRLSRLGPFSWHPPVEAPVSSYQVRVQKDRTSPPRWVVDQSGIVSSTFGLTNDLEGNGSYHWQVRPVYTSGAFCDSESSWSKEADLIRQAPGPVGLTASVEQNMAQFSWSAVAGAQSYDLQIAADTSFASPFYEKRGLSVNSHTPTNLKYQDGVLYYWRVKSIQPGGIEDGWSKVETFVITHAQPLKKFIIPGDVQAGLHSENPSLCWSLANGAHQYVVQMAYDSQFKVGLVEGKTVQTCYTHPDAMANGKIYWRVASVDSFGVRSKYSSGDAFQKQYRAPVPVKMQDLSQQSPLFAWIPVQGAAGYRLEILNPYTRVVLKTFETTANAYRPTELLHLTVYAWRVAVIDNASPQPNLGPYSSEILVQNSKNRIYLSLIRR